MRALLIPFRLYCVPPRVGMVFPIFCVRWWVVSPRPPPRWMGLPIFACRGFPGLVFRLPLSSPLPFLFLLLLPYLSLALFFLLQVFLPISSPLFPPVSSSFRPFLPPAPPTVASSSSSFSVSSLLSPPVSSAMPSFPVPLVSALPHLSSLGCSSLSSFASVTLSSSVASWSSPLVVSSSLAPISSVPWPVVPPVSSVPPFPTPPLTFPVSSLFTPAPSTVASSSSLPP